MWLPLDDPGFEPCHAHPVRPLSFFLSANPSNRCYTARKNFMLLFKSLPQSFVWQLLVHESSLYGDLEFVDIFVLSYISQAILCSYIFIYLFFFSIYICRLLFIIYLWYAHIDLCPVLVLVACRVLVFLHFKCILHFKSPELTSA